MIAARDGQLNAAPVYFMSLDSDTEGCSTADAGSMLLRLDWQARTASWPCLTPPLRSSTPHRRRGRTLRLRRGRAAKRCAQAPPDRAASERTRRQQPGHPCRKPHRYVGDSRTAGVLRYRPPTPTFICSAPMPSSATATTACRTGCRPACRPARWRSCTTSQTLVFTGSQADVLVKPAE